MTEKSNQPIAVSKVLVISPYSGDIERNRIYAQECCRMLFNAGYNPFAPHLYYPQFLNDNDKEERLAGMNLGRLMTKDCMTAYVFTDLGITPGMEADITWCSSKGIHVFFEKCNSAVEIVHAFERMKVAADSESAGWNGHGSEVLLKERASTYDESWMAHFEKQWEAYVKLRREHVLMGTLPKETPPAVDEIMDKFRREVSSVALKESTVSLANELSLNLVETPVDARRIIPPGTLCYMWNDDNLCTAVVQQLSQVKFSNNQYVGLDGKTYQYARPFTDGTPNHVTKRRHRI